MGWLKQETAYERRLRELDEEAERIRKNMQSIMKNTSRETSARPTPSPSFKSRNNSAPPSSRLAAEPPNRYDADDTHMDESSYDGQVEDETLIQPLAGVSPDYNRRAPFQAKPEKLANYLASGSFGKGGSLSRERRIQRNKAIFMMIVALIAIYSLYAWLK